MVVPKAVDRPKMIRRDELHQAVQWRWGRSGADLGGKSPSATTVVVSLPVYWGFPLVGPAHLHAGAAGVDGGLDDRIRPLEASLDAQEGLLDGRNWHLVAAVEEDHHAGVFPQPVHQGAERFIGDGLLSRIPA